MSTSDSKARHLVWGLDPTSPIERPPDEVSAWTANTGGAPDYITAGPDGNLWFTDPGSNQIGRIIPSGVVTEFAVPTTERSLPQEITAEDDSIWFTQPGTNQMGYLTVTMNGVAFEEFSISAVSPWGFAPGPDGNLWFTDPGQT